MSADEKRIREFAYQIWESEGCPDGQAERHWAMARQLAEAEAAAAAPKKTRGRAKAAKETPALLLSLIHISEPTRRSYISY
ncbi:DUF2934 domain-containing protein, partial [Pseudomonas aeruginosa]|uniref:DUF2934 domain-containing protein n=1 Tax=Pseudomonas aeruginosa TaxID=287 RepID=UPI001C673EB2